MIPSPPLPEMTLPAAAVVPPIVVSGALARSTPDWKFPAPSANGVGGVHQDRPIDPDSVALDEGAGAVGDRDAVAEVARDGVARAGLPVPPMTLRSAPVTGVPWAFRPMAMPSLLLRMIVLPVIRLFGGRGRRGGGERSNPYAVPAEDGGLIRTPARPCCCR